MLPPYVLILNVTAGEWFPEEKMDYQMEALEEISRTYLLKPMESLPGVQEAEKTITEQLYQPWNNGGLLEIPGAGRFTGNFLFDPLEQSP